MNQPAALLDCRSLPAYCAGHVAGATSLPATELFERMHELPQRHLPLALCGDTESLSIARHFLLDRGFLLGDETLWTDTLAQALATEGRLETGPHSRRLWQPSPLLRYFVEELLPQHPPSLRQGVDIACGSGRDLVFMAMHGWAMLGVDDSADALQRAQALARHHGVHVEALQLDLEKHDQPLAGHKALQPGRAGLVSVFRYLHRPLLPQLRELLAPGGFIVYQTFMQGCEKIGSPRNPRFLLQPGELADAFAGFTILLDDICHLQDGRPVSAFIARKPS